MLRPKLDSPSGIYLIINHVNGNVYVGSSRRLGSRWSSHRRGLETNRHDGPGLQAAWNKYGAESFSFEVLEYCEPELLFEREQHYIDTLKPRYNRNMTAGKPPINDGSEERRRQTSEFFKGRTHTEQTKQRMSEAAKGRKVSEQTRERMRVAAAIRGESRRGKRDPEDVLAKKSAAQRERAAKNPGLPHLDAARRNRAKIKGDQVYEVWSLHDQGLTYDQIAEIYNVRYWVIGGIIRKGRPATCPDRP